MELNKHVEEVVKFMKNAGQKTPESICNPSLDDRKLRAKLILEEVFELINRGLGLDVYLKPKDHYLDPLSSADFDLSLTENGGSDIVEAMDGAADLFWVGVAGTSIIFGCQLEPVLNEVNRSNASKFIDGHRREDGKWVKGPSYTPADVQSVLLDRIPF